MPIATGTHKLGPENAALTVNTGRSGAAAKAGHDLVIAVTAWEATVEVADGATPTGLTLDADPTSLRVRSGTGGAKALGDDDIAKIHSSIDDDVLKRKGITFRSTLVQAAPDGSLTVQGELDLRGTARPISFDLAVGDRGRLSGSAVVKQTDWGMKPYSALFGALKVSDEVEVVIEAQLPAS